MSVGPDGSVWLVGGAAVQWNDGEVSPLDEAVVGTNVWWDGEDTLWGTGRVGSIARMSGGAWDLVDSGVSEGLLELWGSGPTDIWGVGIDGVMTHWNGERWSGIEPVTRLHVSGISGLAPDNIWAVANVGGLDLDETAAVLRWDGAEWTASPFDHILHAVWAIADDDVWAVGQSVYHWDGASWSEADVEGGQWSSIWASGPDDVWVAAPAQRVIHYDGTSWTTVLDEAGFIGDVWGRPGVDVWVPGPSGIAYRCVY